MEINHDKRPNFRFIHTCNLCNLGHSVDDNILCPSTHIKIFHRWKWNTCTCRMNVQARLKFFQTAIQCVNAYGMWPHDKTVWRKLTVIFKVSSAKLFHVEKLPFCVYAPTVVQCTKFNRNYKIAIPFTIFTWGWVYAEYTSWTIPLGGLCEITVVKCQNCQHSQDDIDCSGSECCLFWKRANVIVFLKTIRA